MELKKIIYDFNSVSSRFMRVDFRESNIVLVKFLDYIDNEELISNYIKDCGEPSIDVKAETEEVIESRGRSYFNLGNTTQEEVTNIYHILKYIRDNDIPVMNVARSYSNSRQYQDMIKGFNERVSMVLIRHIEGYLTKIGIDMGMDESVKYSITVNNGQVNLASDNATINANQFNEIDVKKLETLIEAIKKEISADISDSDAEKLNDSIEVIENELTQSKPKKSLLNTALAGLQSIKGTAEFGAAVVALVQFIKSII
jgi:F0F1-type ATP synthase epsilon subunit